MPGDEAKTQNKRAIILKVYDLRRWLDAFMRDRKSSNKAPDTIEYYRRQLADFEAYAASQGAEEVTDISADMIRGYLLDLEARGRNAGGRHAKYRAVRAFLNWWEVETEPDNWTNPITKVKPPKVELEPIQGASMADIKALLATCGNDFIGARDRAILLCLLDTGTRVREFLAVDLADLDPVTGSVIVRKTKGKEPRIVFIGKKSRRALRAYLKIREDDNAALWVSQEGERLAVKSLQGMIERRGALAGLKDTPSPHDFRRAHVLMMIRAGVDLITLSRLTGHKDLQTLKRYAKQTTEDLRAAHDRAGVVDRIF